MSIHKLDTKVFLGQKAFIEKGGKVLVLKDPTKLVLGQAGLDFPGGKYRWGHPLEAELKREVKEETNLEIEIGRPFCIWTTNGTRRKTKNAHIVLIGFLCKYKSGKVRLSDEHVEYEWVDENTYTKWKESTEYFEAL